MAIFLMANGNPQYDAPANFRLALATASLLASLLCVWVLLVIAFARKYISHLRPGTTLLAALAIALPLALAAPLLSLIDPQSLWSPTVALLLALLWSSVGLYAVLWYLTLGPVASANDTR